MNQSLVSCCNNLFNSTITSSTSSSNSSSTLQSHNGCYSRLSHQDSTISESVTIATASGCEQRTTAVIVSPSSANSHQYPSTVLSDLAAPFDATAFCGASPYSAATATGCQTPYFGAENAAVGTPMLHAQNFLPPYCGLSPSLSEFNMLQMCYQPLFSELQIASPGSEASPTAESLYGFANRLHPIAPAGAHPQFAMPQSYPQTRNGYMSGVVSRPSSAAGKRGGRRPKEYEDYDHVALSEEERDKRDKRRLRNKEAAARCRQRRLDLMGSLQTQVEQLKEENKLKDSKIAELQQLKRELLAIVREHQCVLPESLRTIEDSYSGVPRSSSSLQQADVQHPTQGIPAHQTQHFAHPQQATLFGSRKRPGGIDIPDLRQPPQHNTMHSGVLAANHTNIQTTMTTVHIKQEPNFKDPTLFDVNSRDTEEELKRPGSLVLGDTGVPMTSYSAVSSSGVVINTPSNIGGNSDYPISMLDGPTGLTPSQLQATPFPGTAGTPLGDNRIIESL